MTPPGIALLKQQLFPFVRPGAPGGGPCPARGGGEGCAQVGNPRRVAAGLGQQRVPRCSAPSAASRPEAHNCCGRHAVQPRTSATRAAHVRGQACHRLQPATACQALLPAARTCLHHPSHSLHQPSRTPPAVPGAGPAWQQTPQPAAAGPWGAAPALQDRYHDGQPWPAGTPGVSCSCEPSWHHHWCPHSCEPSWHHHWGPQRPGDWRGASEQRSCAVLPGSARPIHARKRSTRDSQQLGAYKKPHLMQGPARLGGWLLPVGVDP